MRLTTFPFILAIVFTIGIIGCEGPQGPQGPAGSQGPEGPQGDDGNANVTRHMFPSHDFTSITTRTLTFSEVDSTEMRESSWNVYLVQIHLSDIYYDHVPGTTNLNHTYSVLTFWDTSASEMKIEIALEDGAGIEYDQIEVVQAVSNNTNDQTSKVVESGSIIPDHVDVTNYKELAEYYDFDNAEHVKVR